MLQPNSTEADLHSVSLSYPELPQARSQPNSTEAALLEISELDPDSPTELHQQCPTDTFVQVVSVYPDRPMALPPEVTMGAISGFALHPFDLLLKMIQAATLFQLLPLDTLLETLAVAP